MADIHLTLGRNTVEATTTSITGYGNNSEAVVYIATNTVVGYKQALVDRLLSLLCLSCEVGNLLSSLCLDRVELLLLCLIVDGTLLNKGISLLYKSLSYGTARTSS